jgi:hypothetical protein
MVLIIGVVPLDANWHTEQADDTTFEGTAELGLKPSRRHGSSRPIGPVPVEVAGSSHT